jgi:hypothetical protein
MFPVQAHLAWKTQVQVGGISAPTGGSSSEGRAHRSQDTIRRRCAAISSEADPGRTMRINPRRIGSKQRSHRSCVRPGTGSSSPWFDSLAALFPININQPAQSAATAGSSTSDRRARRQQPSASRERLESRTRVKQRTKSVHSRSSPTSEPIASREVGIKQRQQATTQADAPQPPPDRARLGQSDPHEPAQKERRQSNPPQPATPGQPQGALQATTSQSSSVRPTTRAWSRSPSGSMFWSRWPETGVAIGISCSIAGGLSS